MIITITYLGSKQKGLSWENKESTPLCMHDILHKKTPRVIYCPCKQSEEVDFKRRGT